MKFEEKLKKTLYDVCSLGDLKKICKARKFPPLPSSVKKEEYAQYVERKFATEEGVEEVCKTLSAEELNILRVLCALENPLTLSDVYYFFDEEDDDFFEKKKLEEIKTRLLWKGLVLLYPSREYESGRCLHAHFSLIEFPRQFEKFIPPLFIPLKPIEKNPPIEDWRKLAKSILLTDFQEKNNKENRFFSLQGFIYISCHAIKSVIIWPVRFNIDSNTSVIVKATGNTHKVTSATNKVCHHLSSVFLDLHFLHYVHPMDIFFFHKSFPQKYFL